MTFAPPLIAVALVLCSTASAQSVTSVYAGETSAVGLLHAVADVLDRNILILGNPQLRVTLSASNTSGEALLTELAGASGLTPFSFSGIEVFAPAGCAPRQVTSLPPLSVEPISLNFTYVSPSALAAVLADFHNLKYENADASLKDPTRLIAIRAKARPAADIYRLLAAVVGVQLAPTSGGRFVIEEEPRCQLEALTPQAIQTIVKKLEGPPKTYCPGLEHDRQRGIASPPRCEPLEQYALEDIVVRGRIERADRATVALVEAPDGLTYAVKQGDYLGYHYGRIKSVDAQGVTVREIKLDQYNYYRERVVHIDYANRREAVE